MTNVEPLRARFVGWIDEKLREVLTTPGAWGGVEALEPLVLVLLMARRRIYDPGTRDQDLVRGYRQFLARVTGPSASRLADRVPREGRERHMVEILGDFVDQAPAETANEAPAARHALSSEGVDVSAPHYRLRLREVS
jgi:hypothetical protein